LLVTGRFNGTIDFGNGALGSAGGFDVFLAKLDPNGIAIWSKRFGDLENEQEPFGVTTDRSNNVLLTGRFKGAMDFGGGPLASAGQDDGFLAKFDPAGGHLWSRSFGDTGSQRGQAVAAEANNEILLVGSTRGTVDCGGGPL